MKIPSPMIAPFLRIVTVLACCASVARAEVKVSALFSNGMILQRGAPIPVWGTANPGETVTVTLGTAKQTATPGPDGKWLLRLPAMAVGEGLEMTVSGQNTLKISNVAIGEVWLASGQSNMELRVPRTLNAQEEIAAANEPLIRQFRVGRSIAATPQTDTKGTWEAASPQTLADFTAVGYYFARELHKKLGVPVGIIHSSYGGTPAEAWTSDATLKSNAELGAVFEHWAKDLANYPQAKEKYDQQMAAWKGHEAAGKPAPISPHGPGDKATPSGLYNGMISPVIPYGIRGVIWYQGETNSHDPELYKKLFPALIKSWRHDWNAEFPFYFVQLANFHKQQTQPSEGGWAFIREAQATALSLPKTGMAVTIDLGLPNEIHYPNKQEVGRRLALVALANQYGQPVESSGPQYVNLTVGPGSLRLKFTHAQGMKAKEGDVKGFAIAGKDGRFVWASAKIEGDSITLSSPEVPAPNVAHYDWADNPIGNLVNAAGLPAVPFRTDPENHAAPASKSTDAPAESFTAEAIPTPMTVANPEVAADGAETPDNPATGAIQPTRRVVYKTTTNAAGEKVELMMNIFEPKDHHASDKTPAVLFFFGGGWNDGSPKSFFPHCAYFASRGLVAIAPDYRVKSRQKTSPFESVTDAKSAMRYVRANAATWGIDPKRIAAAGSSAGGHVAACTAILPGFDEKIEDAGVSSVPNALVLYNPVIDNSPTGYGNARLGERWEEISPLQHVRPGLPPTLVFHGTADKIVPYANAVSFEKAMQGAGDRCELVTIQGEGHGFVYRLEKKSANRAVRETDVFLASLGYLQGEPTLPGPTR